MATVPQFVVQIIIAYDIIVSMVGIAGNVLTIIMLSKRSLTKNFNNCTLIALALTDLLFNLALISRCINDLVKINWKHYCQLLSFVSHLAELLSACFTAHFTFQRFIAVRFPLSVFIEKRIHLLHYFIVTIFLLFGISYCLGLIYSNNYDDCEEESNLKWFISDALLSFVIPFTIIAILNLLIIFQLRKTYKENPKILLKKRKINKQNLEISSKTKRKMSCDLNSLSRYSENITFSNIKPLVYQYRTSTETNDNLLSVDQNSNDRTPSVRSTAYAHVQSHRVTRMLILVSTCFLFLNAPSHMCAISLKMYTLKKSSLNNNLYPLQYNQTNTIENLILTSTAFNLNHKSNINMTFFRIFYIIVIVTQHISYLSYSINFFLYSFCGIKFRRDLMKCLTPSRL